MFGASFQLFKTPYCFFFVQYFRSRMGLLAMGSPLSWDETKKHADYVRKHGIIQFLHIYHRLKNRQNDILKWGDEVSLCATVVHNPE